MHTTRIANLLGASSLALGDLMMTRTTAAANTSGSGAAALVILSCTPGISVTELGRRTGLTQSAAGRMVDGLESRGLVTRERGLAGGLTLRLTAAGSHAAHNLLTARGDTMATAIDQLDTTEQEQLEGLLTKLLTGIYHQHGEAQRICRLCDRDACTSDGQCCPVGQAERDAQGTDAGL